MEEEGGGNGRREEGKKKRRRNIHSHEDGLQAIGRITLHTVIASVGEPVKIDVPTVPPQVLVHTLVVCTLKLLSVHHHREGIW